MGKIPWKRVLAGRVGEEVADSPVGFIRVQHQGGGAHTADGGKMMSMFLFECFVSYLGNLPGWYTLNVCISIENLP